MEFSCCLLTPKPMVFPFPPPVKCCLFCETSVQEPYTLYNPAHLEAEDTQAGLGYAICRINCQTRQAAKRKTLNSALSAEATTARVSAGLFESWSAARGPGSPWEAGRMAEVGQACCSFPTSPRQPSSGMWVSYPGTQ